MSKRDEYEKRVEAYLMPVMEKNQFELVDVEYGAPSDKVKSLLKKIVDEEKRIVYAPTAPANPTIALNALRDSSVQFVVRAWVKKEDVPALKLWEGDRVFLELLTKEEPFFLLKLTYRGEQLAGAVLNGHPLAL